jgi:hypothetical protein
LRTGLDRTQSWKELFGGGVQRGIGRWLASRRSRVVDFLLASALLAKDRRWRGIRDVLFVGSRRGRMGNILLVRDFLNRGMVIVLLHELLGGGQALGRR